MSDQPRHAMSVLGPVPVEMLGFTLPHEHVLLDLTCLWHPPLYDWQENLVDAAPTLDRRGDLSIDPYVSRSNLRLDDVALAIEELQTYREVGGTTVVDLTVAGIGPRPALLREISRATGLTIVAGCGWYVQRAHPEGGAELSEEKLAEQLIQEIENGFGDTGVRPGIIGEIGTSAPIHPSEAKRLRAAARAQRATGLAINVHVAIFGGRALEALDFLDAAGADLSRVAISHLDELLDPEYHRTVLRRGAYVEFDTFGSEFTFEDDRREPTDQERVDALLRLLDDGWADQLLLSQDVCTKVQLRHYGGHGYSHLLRTIVPRLRRHGLDEATIRTLTEENPARLLGLGG